MKFASPLDLVLALVSITTLLAHGEDILKDSGAVLTYDGIQRDGFDASEIFAGVYWSRNCLKTALTDHSGMNLAGLILEDNVI